MVFHWSLCDSKSPQVSRTLHSILAILNNAVFWMLSTRPPTSKSSSPFSNPLVTIPNALITIGIIVTCMFHSFFNSLARSRCLSLFSHSFSFIPYSAGTAKSTILQVLSFLLSPGSINIWEFVWIFSETSFNFQLSTLFTRIHYFTDIKTYLNFLIKF